MRIASFNVENLFARVLVARHCGELPVRTELGDQVVDHAGVGPACVRAGHPRRRRSLRRIAQMLMST
jgi:hypothetical protein